MSTLVTRKNIDTLYSVITTDDAGNKNLYVRNTDFKNTMVIFNDLFQPFTLSSTDNSIAVFPPESPINGCYLMDDIVRYYAWYDIEIVKTKPTGVNGNKLVFDTDVSNAAFVIYNKILYLFDPDIDDNKQLTMKGFYNLETAMQKVALDLDNTYAVTFKSKSYPDKKYFYQKLKGVITPAERKATFTADISNALIVANGVPHPYIVQDDNMSVKLPIGSIGSLYETDSVYAINIFEE